MSTAEESRRYRATHPEYVRRNNEQTNARRKRKLASEAGYRERYNQRAREAMRQLRSKDPKFKMRQVSSSAEWRAKLKDEVFSAYGGYRCACCGETQRFFLQLDHINGNGCKERKELCGKNVGSNCYVIYGQLRKLGFPPGYQVLCANCNVGKHRNGGICPHAESSQKTTK